MKLPLLSTLTALVRAHLLALTVGMLVVALSIGGFYGWRYYQYLQSSEYALDRLRTALTPPQPEKLAQYVDFNTLSGHLAKAMTETFPFLKSGDDQIHDLKNIIQTALLKKFLSKEDADKKDAKTEEDSEKLLYQPLVLLPPDFIAQFLAGLSMRQTEGGTVLLSTSITHPQLKRTFPLILRMINRPEGWIVRDLVNGSGLTKLLRSALIERLVARHDIQVRKNAAIRKRMDSILALQSCTASAGLLSDKKTMVMVAHVLARNTGAVSVNNLALDVIFYGPDGQELLRRVLNTARGAAPGENFDQRWTIEMDGQDPQAQGLLAARELTCQARWRTLGLSSAEVLHIADVPDTLKPCDKQGHEHPQSFCIAPIFQN